MDGNYWAGLGLLARKMAAVGTKTSKVDIYIHVHIQWISRSMNFNFPWMKQCVHRAPLKKVLFVRCIWNLALFLALIVCHTILFTKCEFDIRSSCWRTKDLKLDTTLKTCPIITSIISSQLVGQLFYKFFCNSLNCGTFYLTLIFILRTYFKEIGKHWITPFDTETEWQDYAQWEFRHLQIFSSVLWKHYGQKSGFSRCTREQWT